MIKINGFRPSDTYFAARNGFSGFESLFPRCFDPKKYEKLYILKGGPGTGKSTLMRGLASFGNERGILTEAILCSSDPDSLDGVILTQGDKRVGVIDGTAPHATDPKYPGAVDEIINLGDGFDKAYLSSRREEIIALDRAKSEAYRSAYSALKGAGEAFKNIKALFRESELYSVAENFANDIVRSLSDCKSYTDFDRRLYSAFGKRGLVHLPYAGEQRALTIGGDAPIVDAVMGICYDRLKGESKVCRISPSPLDDGIIERIYTSDLVLLGSSESECDIDLSEYRIGGDLATLYKEYGSLLTSAKEHFDTASRAHFEIERIYRGGVDFARNDRIFDSLANEISDILAIH